MSPGLDAAGAENRGVHADTDLRAESLYRPDPVRVQIAVF
jgi:hypothetical protein